MALASEGQDVHLIHVAVAGVLARAQGFHEGTVAAVEADNPYAAFTLLRSYAENAAALIYLRDKPAQGSCKVGPPLLPVWRFGIVLAGARSGD